VTYNKTGRLHTVINTALKLIKRKELRNPVDVCCNMLLVECFGSRDYTHAVKCTHNRILVL